MQDCVASRDARVVGVSDAHGGGNGGDEDTSVGVEGGVVGAPVAGVSDDGADATFVADGVQVRFGRGEQRRELREVVCRGDDGGSDDDLLAGHRRLGVVTLPRSPDGTA